MKENALTRSNCMKRFSEISNLFQDYMDEGKTDDALKKKISTKAFQFRQALRRQNKKLKRKDSLTNTGDFEHDP